MRFHRGGGGGVLEEGVNSSVSTLANGPRIKKKSANFKRIKQRYNSVLNCKGVHYSFI